MEIVTKVMEKSWKSHGNLLVKMCTNPVNKRGKVSSPVWQFFGYYKSERSQTNVVCKPWRGTASVPYDKESKRYKDITEAVAYHIAKDMLPLRLDNC